MSADPMTGRRARDAIRAHWSSIVGFALNERVADQEW